MAAFVSRRLNRERLVLASLLLLLAVVPFARSVGFEFVWDDYDLIVLNPAFGPSGSYLDFFRHDMWWWQGSAEFGHQFWRPVTLSAFRLIIDGFGMAPRALHGLSVLLHATTALLLFAFVSGYLSARLAFLAAALFAVHPLRVESVAWISGTGDLLCGAFLIGALWLHERAIQLRRHRLHAVSLAAFLFALMSKEAAFVFPVLLSLFLVAGPEGTPDDDERAVRVRWLGAYCLLAVMVGLYRTTITESALSAGAFSTAERVLTMPVLFVRYLADMVAPVDWTIHSTMAVVSSVGDRRLLASVLALGVAVTLVRLAWRQTASRVLAPVAWTTSFLAPVCIIGFSSALYSERYTYLASMGFSVLLVAAAHAGLQRLERRRRGALAAGAVVGGALILASAVTSFARTAAWRDDESLYAQMIEQDPTDSVPLYNLGMRAVNRADWQAARSYFERALPLAPDDSRILNSLGNLAAMRGDQQSAIEYFRRAVQRGPNPAAMFNLAELLSQGRACSEALAYYRGFLEHVTPDLAQQRALAEQGIARNEALIRQGMCR